MRKHCTLLAAASLTAGALAFFGYDHSVLAQMQGSVGTSSSGRVALSQEISPTGQPDAQGIQSTLAAATDAAIRNTNQLPNFFAPSDQQRLSDFSQQQHQRLITALGNFRAAWQDTYHQDFNFNDHPQVVLTDPNSNLLLVQFQVSTPPALLSNQPVQSAQQRQPQGEEFNKPSHTEYGTPPAGGPNHAGVGGPGEPPAYVVPPPTPEHITTRKQQRGHAVQAGQAQAPGGVSTPPSGLELAIVTFPPGHSLPQTNVALVHTPSTGAVQAAGTSVPTNWRIDVPDSLTSSQLSNHLANHIEGLVAGRDTWPNDVNDAYRMVAHHVMQAIYEPTTPGQGG